MKEKTKTVPINSLVYLIQNWEKCLHVEVWLKVNIGAISACTTNGAHEGFASAKAEK